VDAVNEKEEEREWFHSTERSAVWTGRDRRYFDGDVLKSIDVVNPLNMTTPVLRVAFLPHNSYHSDFSMAMFPI